MRGRRLVSMVAVLALLASVLAVPVALAQQTAAPTTGAATVPISGSGPNSTVSGTYTIKRFIAKNGQLAAVGTLTGTVTNTATGVTRNVTRALTLPVSASGTCDILHLTLGPLDLNLLGLMVHLDQVVLDITAQSGPGNLLGNLLCSVAGLLDNNGGLNAITQLLNQILAALGGL